MHRLTGFNGQHLFHFRVVTMFCYLIGLKRFVYLTKMGCQR